MHILLVPGILLALIGVHVGLVWYQKHTQFPGVRRKETNVVGVRILPTFALKAGGFTAVVIGVTRVAGRAVPDQPDLELRPVQRGAHLRRHRARLVHGLDRRSGPTVAGVGGLSRELHDSRAVLPVHAGLPLLTGIAAVYPWIERKFTKDYAHHNLLQRPRDVPVRTSLGVMAITYFMVSLLSAANDVLADKFDISLNATTWAGRIGLLLLPPLAYVVTYRLCLGLQRSDRHGARARRGDRHHQAAAAR